MVQFHITNSSGALIIAVTTIANWRYWPDHILLLYAALKISQNQLSGFCLQFLRGEVYKIERKDASYCDHIKLHFALTMTDRLAGLT
jgi:hypothetical protein